MSRTGLFYLLFAAGIVVACIDQFAFHGTSFEWVPASKGTWMDGWAFGLLCAAWSTLLLKRDALRKIRSAVGEMNDGKNCPKCGRRESHPHYDDGFIWVEAAS